MRFRRLTYKDRPSPKARQISTENCRFSQSHPFFWKLKSGKSKGGFLEGGFSNNRVVLKPDVAIASEVSILSTNSLAITDFHAKKTQHVQLFENPFLETPHSRFPTRVRPGPTPRKPADFRRLFFLVLSILLHHYIPSCRS